MRRFFVRWVIYILLTAVFAAAFSISALAQSEQLVRLWDNAGLLDSAARTELEQKLVEMREQLDIDFAILTIDENSMGSARLYADDFYERTGLGIGGDYSGVLVLLDMDTRELYLAYDGKAERYLTDERRESVLDSAYTYLASGDYAGALSASLDSIELYMKQGIPSDQHTYDEDTGKVVSRYRSITPFEGTAALGAGLIGALCYYFWIKRSYSLAVKTPTYQFREKSFVAMDVLEDVRTGQFVTTRVIPKNTGSGGSGGSSSRSSGRTTVHRTRSGRSMGGGGRKF